MTEPETFIFADDGAIPNSPLPLLIYRRAVPADPAAIERIFAENGWPPAWRDGVHPFHHFHSTAHEVLGVARGSATVMFGGPVGRVLDVQAGDVVVLPAGVGHCNQSQSPDLLIVGAYPERRPEEMAERLDTRRGKPAEHDEVTRNIAAVALPSCDPVVGRDGPLPRLWNIPPRTG
ncbi:MAG TPA: cupin domain-containing protein [Acetobacteraceae bacterium]|nr:cupin domain-containing protein [Acetobacteraceae bacterium]